MPPPCPDAAAFCPIVSIADRLPAPDGMQPHGRNALHLLVAFAIKLPAEDVRIEFLVRPAVRVGIETAGTARPAARSWPSMVSGSTPAR